jgi:sialidase-1
VFVAVLMLTSGTVGVVAGMASASSTADDASAANLAGETVSQAQTAGVTRGSPDLSVTIPRPEVTPGRTNEVSLQVINDGEMSPGTPQTREVVTTARNVRLTAESDDNPLTVETGTLAIALLKSDLISRYHGFRRVKPRKSNLTWRSISSTSSSSVVT